MAQLRRLGLFFVRAQHTSRQGRGTYPWTGRTDQRWATLNASTNGCACGFRPLPKPGIAFSNLFTSATASAATTSGEAVVLWDCGGDPLSAGATFQKVRETPPTLAVTSPDGGRGPPQKPASRHDDTSRDCHPLRGIEGRFTEKHK